MKLNYKYIVGLAIFFAGSFLFLKQVFAETVATSVTVGNSAPSFTTQTYEVTTSSTTTPTNVGTTVTFSATAIDGNNENYYLIVCKSAAVTANTNAAPTCTGGAWCVSGSTTSGQAASCGYGTLQADAESNNWYSYVCDHSPSSACVQSTNTNDNGSPFEVNHPPSFVSIGNTTPLNPGSTQTWTTTVGTSDADTGASDTVRLLVCKTSGVTAGNCDGGASDTWCTGSAVTNSPSCSVGVSIPTAADIYNSYVYVFDNHGLGATGAVQASNKTYTVNNVAPIISDITLNSEVGTSNITLNEGTTTPVVLGATITDNNGCSTISTVTASLYRSSVTYASCDQVGDSDPNDCYPVITCAVNDSINSCTGADASAAYKCTADVQYFADPTVANTTYSADTWLDTFFASDGTLDDTLDISPGVELNDLVAMDIGAAIEYGTLDAGTTQTPLASTTVITATGNVGLDQEISGTDMTSGGNTIIAANQRYALAVSTAYGSGAALSSTPTESELNCKKTTILGTGETKPTYWGISIPLGTVAGTYSGTNTITAVKGEYAQW